MIFDQCWKELSETILIFGSCETSLPCWLYCLNRFHYLLDFLQYSLTYDLLWSFAKISHLDKMLALSSFQMEHSCFDLSNWNRKLRQIGFHIWSKCIKSNSTSFLLLLILTCFWCLRKVLTALMFSEEAFSFLYLSLSQVHSFCLLCLQIAFKLTILNHLNFAHFS